MSNGWIKLHRKIQDNPIWDKPEQLKAWIDILLMVTHTERTKFIKGQEVVLKQGEVDASFRYLAKRWGWSIGKVQRFLILLKKCSMIEVKTGTGQNLISVCNYGIYQIEQNQNDTQVGTAPIQHRYENKNVKKERTYIYSVEFDEIWKLYPVKKNKHISFLKYKKALKDKSHNQLKDILEKHISSWVGKEKQYLPHLSTWLNQKRYLDEITKEDNQPVKQQTKKRYICDGCDTDKVVDGELRSDDLFCGCGGEFLQEWEYKHRKGIAEPIPVKTDQQKEIENLNKILAEGFKA